MKIFECSKCNSKKTFTKTNGNQTGLYCSDCGKWIKWLTKEEIRLYELQHNKPVICHDVDRIECGACGFLGAENVWYNFSLHNKVKICPKCGTLKFVHENNKRCIRE